MALPPYGSVPIDKSCTIAVPFCNPKLRVPSGVVRLMDGLTREVLRAKPRNIPEFAARHFSKLVGVRKETGVDPALVAVVHTDQVVEEEKVCKVVFSCETRAARIIQKAYRQFLAARRAEQLMLKLAAIRIQTAFRAYNARKHYLAMQLAMGRGSKYGRRRSVWRDDCGDIIDLEALGPSKPDLGFCYGVATLTADEMVEECMEKFDDPFWTALDIEDEGFDPCRDYDPKGQRIPPERRGKRGRELRKKAKKGEKPMDMDVPDCPDTFGRTTELLTPAEQECLDMRARKKEVVCEDEVDDDYFNDIDSSHSSDATDEDSEDEYGGEEEEEEVWVARKDVTNMECVEMTGWPREKGARFQDLGLCYEPPPCGELRAAALAAEKTARRIKADMDKKEAERAARARAEAEYEEEEEEEKLHEQEEVEHNDAGDGSSSSMTTRIKSIPDLTEVGGEHLDGTDNFDDDLGLFGDEGEGSAEGGLGEGDEEKRGSLGEEGSVGAVVKFLDEN